MDFFDDFFRFLGPVIYLCIGLVILVVIAQWRIYEKAGKPGWAAIIPIYNVIVLMEIIGKPPWWVVLYFIPMVNLVFAVWALNLLSKSFGKDEAFTIGLVFLGVIFYPILGFGDAEYQGPAGDYVYDSYRAGPAKDEDDDLV